MEKMGRLLLQNTLPSCIVASQPKLATESPPYSAYIVGNYNLSSLGEDPEATCEFMVTMTTMKLLQIMRSHMLGLVFISEQVRHNLRVSTLNSIP